MPSFRRFIKSNWPIVVAIVIVGFLAIATWNSQSLNPFSSSAIKPSPPRFDRLHATGLHYNTIIAGQKVVLMVQEVTHAKRKIGPLTVNPLKELELSDVILHIDSGPVISKQPPSAPPTSSNPPKSLSRNASPQIRFPVVINDLPTILTDLFRAKDLGFISRVHIHGLKIQATKHDHTRFSLVAHEAKVDMTNPVVSFSKGFSIETPTQQQLVANEAEWRPTSQTLFIPTTFVFKDPQKEFAGKKVSFRFSPEGTLLGPDS